MSGIIIVLIKIRKILTDASNMWDLMISDGIKFHRNIFGIDIGN